MLLFFPLITHLLYWVLLLLQFWNDWSSGCLQRPYLCRLLAFHVRTTMSSAPLQFVAHNLWPSHLVCYILSLFYSFTGFINRMRGYHSVKNKSPGYENGLLPNSYYYVPPENKLAMHTYTALNGAFFNREFPTSWRDIDKSVGNLPIRFKERMWRMTLLSTFQIEMVSRLTHTSRYLTRRVSVKSIRLTLNQRSPFFFRGYRCPIVYFTCTHSLPLQSH